MRLILALLLPWLTFFTIGRPIAGVICLILQVTVIGWLPATIWAVYALSQYKTDKKIEKALAPNKESARIVPLTSAPGNPEGQQHSGTTAKSGSDGSAIVSNSVAAAVVQESSPVTGTRTANEQSSASLKPTNSEVSVPLSVSDENPVNKTAGCPNCTTELRATDVFCGNCGTRVASQEATPTTAAPAPAISSPALNPASSMPADVTAISSTPSALNSKGKKSKNLVAIAAVAGVVVAGAGGYKLMQKTPTRSAPTPSVQSAAPGKEIAPVNVQVQPKPEHVDSRPVTAHSKDTESLLPIEKSPEKPSRTQSQAPKASQASETSRKLRETINATLADGTSCMHRKQFDCVIANANTVLRMEPGNRQAINMKRQAQDAQNRALAQIRIQ